MNRKKRIHRQELRAPEATPVVAEVKKDKPKAKAKVEVKVEESKGE